MPSALDVARYFLHLAAQTQEPSPLTHMQLHKLLYYAQGWSLGSRGVSLFAAEFQAWKHGPVAVNVYPKFADYNAFPIPNSEAADSPALSGDDRALVESIWLGYGKYAAWQLREMTHNESPWRNARGELPEDAPGNTVITDTAMQEFFSLQHQRACKRFHVSPSELSLRVHDARQGRVQSLDEFRTNLLAATARHEG